ncbi:MAG: magnesium transporter CorA family protein [Lysobacteraceae bacterium]
MAALGGSDDTRLPGEHDGTCVRIMLFDADADDQVLEESAIDPATLGERQLLWVDVEDDDAEVAEPVVRRLVERLRLGPAAPALLRQIDGRPRLHNVGDWFLVQVTAVEHGSALQFPGRTLAIVCGRNLVLTLHRGPLEFLNQLRGREHAETRLGSLSAESFAASLLDWQIESYLHAVTDFEAAVDRLEVAILASKVQRESLPDLARLRRGASRLRRMLAPHRHVFGALARPDFRPDAEEAVNRQFRALEQRFERAMDAVENARELVVGSFELFTTRAAQRTNDTMRVLTFVTVLTGSLAVISGALGMNFKAPLFESAGAGFWTTIAAMGVIIVASVLFARWRRWF